MLVASYGVTVISNKRRPILFSLLMRAVNAADYPLVVARTTNEWDCHIVIPVESDCDCDTPVVHSSLESTIA
jgi:hypothetical protein